MNEVKVDPAKTVRDRQGNIFVRDAEPLKETYFDEENQVHYYEVKLLFVWNECKNSFCKRLGDYLD